VYTKDGPTFAELMRQALSSTEQGYDLLAPKFEQTPFCTPSSVIERCLGDLAPVETALDLCCGTGAGLVGLLPLVRQRLVGVDFSEGMLREARTKVALHKGKQPEKLELVHRDLYGYPAAGEFDLVTCFGALGHIEERDEPKFLSLVRNHLKPGGRFVFVTTRSASPLSKRAIVGRAFNGVMRVRNLLIKPPFIMYYLTFELPKIERLLRFHGFDVHVREGLFPAPYLELVRVTAQRRS
jgi:SAM-dependent methyltransferase